MKKQILTLTLFVLAVFAGLTSTYGQGDNNPNPIIADGDPTSYIDYLTPSGAIETAPVTTLPCIATIDELHPQTGVVYTYTVTVDPTGSRVHWFVTDETNIITALNNITGPDIDPGDGSGDYILTTSSGTVYNTPDNTTNTVDISWKSFDGTTAPVLLVTYVVDDAGCTDNIQVYRIEPVFNFTLDIAGLNDDGTVTTTPSECVSPVESANYDATANSGAGGLVVDYGENWLFFTVTAANFTHSWMPEFQVNYTGTAEEAIIVEWAYPVDANAGTDWHTTTSSGTGPYLFTSSDAVLHSGTDLGNGITGADDGTGEAIVVRVRVDHGTNENPQTTNQTLTLGVNGTMYDANAASTSANYTNSLLDDLGPDGDSNGECDQVDFDDTQDYTLTPRPLINSSTGTGPLPFIQKN